MRTVSKRIVAAARLRFRRAGRLTPVRLLAVLVTATLGMACTPSYAAAYPERIIKIVVPFPAGGPTDVAARLIASRRPRS